VEVPEQVPESLRVQWSVVLAVLRPERGPWLGMRRCKQVVEVRRSRMQEIHKARKMRTGIHKVRRIRGTMAAVRMVMRGGTVLTIRPARTILGVKVGINLLVAVTAEAEVEVEAEAMEAASLTISFEDAVEINERS